MPCYAINCRCARSGPALFRARIITWPQLKFTRPFGQPRDYLQPRFTATLFFAIDFHRHEGRLVSAAGMPRLTRSSARLANMPQKSTPPAAAPGPTPKPVNAPVSTPSTTHLHFKDSSAFETWLSTHHATNPGTWLLISKKASTVPSITYDEAVNAALCHGWIDGQRKSHSATSFAQRFTPRRKGSIWSKRNVDRVAALTAAGRMLPAGQAEVDAAEADGRWERAYAGSREIEVPPELQSALEGNAEARRFLETLSRSQRYPFLFRIATAKRAETRERKARQFVELLAQGKTL